MRKVWIGRKCPLAMGRRWSCNINRMHYLMDRQHSWTQIFRRALTRPFMIFGREFIAQLLGMYMAFAYGTFYRPFTLFLVFY